MDFSIVSDHAYVAAATVRCFRCDQPIEVICIYCDCGTASGERLTRFTATDVLAIDDSLAEQLIAWPGLRQMMAAKGRSFINSCPFCGAEQIERDLHLRPSDPFFDIPRAAAGTIRLTPLTGLVRLSGDVHFMIE